MTTHPHPTALAHAQGATISELGLVLSQFAFNRMPNANARPGEGAFAVQSTATICGSSGNDPGACTLQKQLLGGSEQRCGCYFPH